LARTGRCGTVALILRVDDHGRKFDGNSNGGTMKVKLDAHFAVSTG
jgi:hypothetical protein